MTFRRAVPVLLEVTQTALKQIGTPTTEKKNARSKVRTGETCTTRRTTTGQRTPSPTTARLTERPLTTTRHRTSPPRLQQPTKPPG